MGQGPLQRCGQQAHGTADIVSSEEVLIPSTLSGEVADCVGGSGSCKDGESADVTNSACTELEGFSNNLKPRQSQPGSYLPPTEIERLVGDDICAICLEPLQGRAQTIALCGHIFHRACLNRCGSGLCPKCRMPIDCPVMSDSPSMSQPSSQGRLGLCVGSLVIIHGLQNHTELNGTRGRIVMCHEMAGRYEVRAIVTNQLFRVKGENLMCADAAANESPPAGSSQVNISADSPSLGQPEGANEARVGEGRANPRTPQPTQTFEPGTVVRLIGLRTQLHFNGQTAEVVSMDRSRGRCEIRLEDGCIKTIAADNLELISATAAASSERL